MAPSSLLKAPSWPVRDPPCSPSCSLPCLTLFRTRAGIGKAQREAKVAARTTAAHDQLSQAEERVFIARANIKDGYHATKDVVDMYRQAVDATNAHLKKLKQEVRKARNLLCVLLQMDAACFPRHPLYSPP